MEPQARADGVDLSGPAGNGCSELTVAKMLTLPDVFAKKGYYPSLFEEMFGREFPTVAHAVRWINGRQSPEDGRRGREHGKLSSGAFQAHGVCLGD